MKYWILGILITIDKAVNVVFAPILNIIFKVKYRFGDHRDTLSEVFGRNTKTCKFCLGICKLMSKLDKRHCEESIED